MDGFKTRVNVTPEEVESSDGWELVQEDYTSNSDKYNMFVSAKGVGIEYIHKVVEEAVETVNKMKEKNEAEPLDTLVSFRVNAPIEKIESFVKEIEFGVEGVYALNLGHVLTVSSDIFDEKHLIDCVGKYFDIV